MGRNLSNLYISSSFQFLTQISGSELQTGLGDKITGSLDITASLANTATSASQAVSASYSNTSTSSSYALVSTTSSFAINANSASYAINATSASYAVTASFALNAGTTVSTASLLTTASAVNNVITFTKGDGSTFPVTVATGSTVSSSFASTASLALLNVLTASNTNATITYTKGDGTTFTNVINNVVNATSASFATSASQAVSASQAQTAVSSSFATSASVATSASFATSASQAVSSSFAISSSVATSASFATSASQATTASFAQNIANGLSPTFANVTASNVLITGTASVALLYTQTISSSVIYSSGSNQFGDASNDVQTLYGTFNVVNGPSNFTGSVNSLNGFTGSLAGTASFAISAATASFTPNAVVTASATNNVITFTKGDGSTFPVTVNTGSVSAFPYTGSAQITGSLSITGSLKVTGSTEITDNLFVSNNLTTGSNNSNMLIVGTGNIVGNNATDSIVVGQSLNIGNDFDNSAVVGGIGHRSTIGYSYIFGGTYNYIGYNSPGPVAGVYNATTVGGSNLTLNGNGSNNIMLIGGDGNQMYVQSDVNQGFLNNSLILGGRNNYITGSNAENSAIISSRYSLINGYSSSVIIGGQNITASASNTVYVPNLRATGSIIQEGSSTSANPAMILASGSGRPLYFYAGGGINPTFDVESNQAIFNWVAGGTQTYQVMGLNNAWYFGYNWGGTPTVEFNANNYGKFYYGLQVSQSLGVTGSIEILSGSFSGSVITNITDTYTTSPKVNKIVTLTQAEYNSIGSPDANTFYVISGSLANATIGSNTFVGNQVISGSLRGNVVSGSTTSNTASLDFSTGNFFTLNTNNVLNTHIVPTNVQSGQTINLELTFPVTASAISFPSYVKQPSGSAYTPSGANTTDILTFIVFNSGSVYLSSVKNMI